MKDDSEIGMEAFQGDVSAPAIQDEERLPDSVIINPRFTVQELAPKALDPRGKRGAEIRVKVTDHYVETTIRRTGARIRLYYNPKA